MMKHHSSILLSLLLAPVIFAGNGDAAGSAGSSTSSISSNADNSPGRISYYHICDAAISAIIAWLVLVITLEVNDFRHHLNAANTQDNNPHRHIASFVAIRLGLRDALVDAAILYFVSYAIVAGFTWGSADPNSLLVIWGISSMVSAALLALAGLKIPMWLGFYKKSPHLQFLKDTSNRASQAVHDLTVEGSTLTSFRYQAHLGVGKHTTQFIFFLLPFYTDLKIWSYFVSLLVGFIFGILYLFVVSKCRQRFRKHRGRVAIGASVALSIISALVFYQGMYVVDSVWEWDIADRDYLLFLVSFFGWLAVCLIIQGIQYYEQQYFLKVGAVEEEEEDDEAHLFIDETTMNDLARRSATEIGLATIEEDETKYEQGGLGVTTTSEPPQEPLAGSTSPRDLFKKEAMDAAEQSFFIIQDTLTG